MSTSLSDFYQYCLNHEIDFPYPLGMCIFLKDNRLYTAMGASHRFYSKMTDSQEKKPAGTYVIGYTEGLTNLEELYERILLFSKAHQLSLTERAYVDFVFTELTMKEPKTFLVKMQIQTIR